MSRNIYLATLSLLVITCRDNASQGTEDREIERDRDHPATVHRLNSFEREPFFSRMALFDNTAVVKTHATHGENALRIDQKDAVILEEETDWSDFDYLKADLFWEGTKPLDLYIAIYDKRTEGYWTRVNYHTAVAPKRSVISLPIKQLFVGEKARPGRGLLTNAVTKLVFVVGDHPGASLYIDNVRLERDLEAKRKRFDGLMAFDFGKPESPLMPGFSRITASSNYSSDLGYGLKDSTIWRSFDVLQPDPLYQDFICIESGGFAVDVPNGTYSVFVNLDNPSGFWGEYQIFRERKIFAEGKAVLSEAMSFESLKEKYFRFWDIEDRPTDNTFNKYQQQYYNEHQFEIAVTDGQLNLAFNGVGWACSVSAIVIFPATKKKEGDAFLDHVVEMRRRFFDNTFKRVLHEPTGKFSPSDTHKERGYATFRRDYMDDVFYNDQPFKGEVGGTISGSGFAGESEPLTVSIYPLKDLGEVSVSISDLSGPGRIPRSHISIGYVSYKISRKTDDGGVYTIIPRYVIPRNSISIEKGTTRRFWMTVRPPAEALPGVYRGELTVSPQKGEASKVPVAYRVYRGVLDDVDIPVGPWGHTMDIPWFEGDEQTIRWNRDMARKSLEMLRETGFTSFSGMPKLRYKGFQNGVPIIDFEIADAQMKLAREAGFSMPVVSYTAIEGLTIYYRDEAAMQLAGFDDYSKYIKALFSKIDSHSRAYHWLPVYWNIGDEPVGDDLTRAIENARAFEKAFPKGPPYFTAATSFYTGDDDDKHFLFGKSLHVANLASHNEKSVEMLRRAGTGWAFYNLGSRWTYGIYMLRDPLKL